MQHTRALLLFLLAHLSRGVKDTLIFHKLKKNTISPLDINDLIEMLKFSFFVSYIGSDDETSVSRLVVTGVTVPQYGVEGKHAVLYCRLHA